LARRLLSAERIKERAEARFNWETTMLDLLFVFIMLVSVGSCIAYTAACERL